MEHYRSVVNSFTPTDSGPEAQKIKADSPLKIEGELKGKHFKRLESITTRGM
jgi:hypothetical protein